MALSDPKDHWYQVFTDGCTPVYQRVKLTAPAGEKFLEYWGRADGQCMPDPMPVGGTATLDCPTKADGRFCFWLRLDNTPKPGTDATNVDVTFPDGVKSYPRVTQPETKACSLNPERTPPPTPAPYDLAVRFYRPFTLGEPPRFDERGFQLLDWSSFEADVSNDGGADSPATTLSIGVRPSDPIHSHIKRTKVIRQTTGCEPSTAPAGTDMRCAIPPMKPGAVRFYTISIDLFPFKGRTTGRVHADIPCLPAEGGSCDNNRDEFRYSVARAPAGAARASAAPIATQPAAQLTEFDGTAGATRSGKAVASRAPGRGPGPVQRVQLAVLQVTGNALAAAITPPKLDCLWLASANGDFGTVSSFGACLQPIWLTAQGTTRWRFPLHGVLPAGKYVLYARAIDGAGRPQRQFDRGSRVEFSLT